VPRAGDRVEVRILRVREQRAFAEQPGHAGPPVSLAQVQVVGPQLIDDDDHDQARHGGGRLGFGSGRAGHEQQAEQGHGQQSSRHAAF
jgi:hypothetical protein